MRDMALLFGRGSGGRRRKVRKNKEHNDLLHGPPIRDKILSFISPLSSASPVKLQAA
jgi:hypothetical protein